MAKNIKDTMIELSKVNVSIQRILADTMIYQEWNLIILMQKNYIC